MDPQPLAVAAAGVALIGALLLGVFGVRVAHSPDDFRTAARDVPSLLSASAMSGEYLSAVAFLGVAGLVLTDGLGMLWYPVGFTAGYVALLVLVAAPLRRFGAFTIPDFVQARLESRAARNVAAAAAIAIAWFLLLPQLDGAGIALQAILGTAPWVGICVLGGVVTAAVATGAMRGITAVQAVLYWMMLMAVAIPALALLTLVNGINTGQITSHELPTFPQATTVRVPSEVTLVVDAPVTVTAHGRLDGKAEDGTITLSVGHHRVGSGSTLRFPEGSRAPHVDGLRAMDGLAWSSPFVRTGTAGAHPLTATYSLLLATFLGAVGLPHLLQHSSTYRDGPGARRTMTVALVLLGIFFLFPTVFAVIGRLQAPGLYATGPADATVIALPRLILTGAGGAWLGALAAAGAFSALVCAGVGLLTGISGTLATSLFRGGVSGFRWSACLAGTLAVLVALSATSIRLGVLAGWAFALAASTLAPLLVLCVWWRRVTSPGAIAGIGVGGGAVGAAVTAHLAGVGTSGWPAVLLALPALWTVPLAFFVMVIGSLATSPALPSDAEGALLRMHLPEELAHARLVGTTPRSGSRMRKQAGRGTMA
jgi:Na+(H+)/acetate symporter ActP